MPKTSYDQRKALGLFLSNRRARLKPEEAGLVAGRRRTPGLRREEVAVLAGVSVSWYTWLEQGRDIQVSSDTLRRLADVLRLNRVEAAHLFALSSRPPPLVMGSGEPSDGLMMLLDAIDFIPAYIRNACFDILAWNTAVTELFIDYAALEPSERNTLRLMFLHAPYRNLILDWKEVAQGYISAFRAARARALDASPFDRLVDELSSASADFRAWWSEVDVTSFDEGVKRLDHPALGRVDLSYLALTPEGRSDLSLVTYVPRPPAGPT